MKRVGNANGRKVQLLGTFVESPLVWAVAGCVDKINILNIADLLNEENTG